MANAQAGPRLALQQLDRRDGIIELWGNGHDGAGRSGGGGAGGVDDRHRTAAETGDEIISGDTGRGLHETVQKGRREGTGTERLDESYRPRSRRRFRKTDVHGTEVYRSS